MGAKQKSPGPAAYTIQNTVGADTPAFSFGSMKRPSPGGNAGISPGPVYQLKTSVGRNKDLIFRHNPAFGFGTMERPDPAGASKLREPPFTLPPLLPEEVKGFSKGISLDETQYILITRDMECSPESCTTAFPPSESPQGCHLGHLATGSCIWLLTVTSCWLHSANINFSPPDFPSNTLAFPLWINPSIQSPLHARSRLSPPVP